MTPEGFSALPNPVNSSVTENFIVQFSRFCNIPDTIADIRKQITYRMSKSQKIWNY